ncbi:MAG: aminopeptidase P family protein [Planctomycetes bacterium]|nr:aminopeptidase P family protein [Planctomycetota bacterium]
MDYPAQRRQRLAEQLRDESLDALLISHPVNVTYLTGFSGESSYLVLSERRTLLVSDARFTTQIQEECPGLEAHIRPPSQSLPRAVVEVLDRLGFRAVGFESAHLSVAEWELYREAAPAINWKGGPERVEKLRAVKDASEIAQIREAIAIAERAFTMFRAMLRPQDSERELADALEMYVRRAGGRCSSFPAIVAVGERAALPHAPPTDKKVAEADLLLVDWGASGRFYKSDLTRTLATRKISPKLEEVYAVVLKAQQQAIARIRPGARGQEIDHEARSVITAAGFGSFFGHGLGHGLGLQVHEAPALRQNSEAVLQPGMVCTVEPGIYLPDWGGVRIEDDVLVTPDGCEVLTRVPRDLETAI